MRHYNVLLYIWAVLGAKFILTAKGEMSVKLFSAVKSPNGTQLCALDPPSVVELTLSLLQCAVLCTTDTMCGDFNYHVNTQQCDLFYCSPSQYAADESCSSNKVVEIPSSANSILVQQNVNGSGAFNKTWVEFKNGFGDINSNYWLGNDQLHSLTLRNSCKIRFDLQSAVDSSWYWAEYATFVVDNETSKYTLHVGNYSGNAGNAMTGANNAFPNYNLNGMKFTTLDSDNDLASSFNCASYNGGGFWYNYCSFARINNKVNTGHNFNWLQTPTLQGPPPGLVLLTTRMTLLC